MTTALNVCRKDQRRSKREEAVIPKMLERPTDRVPEGTVTDVRAALARLPYRQRQAAILYYWGDLPVAAVAELMGSAEGTVRALLTQARKSLRPLLEVSDV